MSIKTFERHMDSWAHGLKMGLKWAWGPGRVRNYQAKMGRGKNKKNKMEKHIKKQIV